LTVHTKEKILPGMVKVQLWGFRCERCDHEWLPRVVDQEPRVCPKCKSPYWNVPRKAVAPTPAKKSAKRTAR
jgi:Zn finger protein HypA/HybF involved in hydrogenase expression